MTKVRLELPIRSLLALGLCLIFGLEPISAFAQADEEFFEKEIRPLLVEHCQSCHGEKKQEGGLQLTSRETLLKGGDTGGAVVPGKSDESLLIKAIEYLD